MRHIHTHKATPDDKALSIQVVGDPDKRGLYSDYRVLSENGLRIDILFQEGSPERDINGLTLEVLLAIAIDRLQCSLKYPHVGREESNALTKLEEALHWLHEKTRAKQAATAALERPAPPST